MDWFGFVLPALILNYFGQGALVLMLRKRSPANEAEIYEALGLQYIEPELREGLDEILCAAARKIPPLVTATDLMA